MKTFRQVIELWPTRAEFARDLGISYNLAAAWYNRDSIPAEQWQLVIDGAAAKGLPGVTADLLTRLAAGRFVRPAPAEGQAA